MAKAGGRYTVVLLRHGESEWNLSNRFTGWYDSKLSDTGRKEARAGGEEIKKAGYKFDIAYTSRLTRAITTCWTALEALDQCYVPVVNSWQLNERHYGSLQGLNKQETVDKHGFEQVNIWRRSYDIPPPPCEESSEHYPGNDERYADVPREKLPLSESTKDTAARVIPYWEEVIVPDIKSGKRVLIAAHGNSLRALVKHLDQIPDDVIPTLNIPTGIPLVYELDENFKPIAHGQAIAPLQGRYLGNQEEIQKKIGAVANQTKKN